MRDPEPLQAAATDLSPLVALLARRAGLRPGPDHLARVRAAVDHLARARSEPPERYVARLLEGDAPLGPLLDEVTVRETYFFRDPAQWRFVDEAVLAPAAARGGTFRAWSAGCSSGEEPYTLAMLAVERGLADRTRVVATDVSPAALARAARARYSIWSLRGGLDPRLGRHLSQDGAELVVAPEVARLVCFRELNLAGDPAGDRRLGLADLDLVLCRNVLIYLARDVVERVARRLFDALAPGGVLLTGGSDPLLSRHAPFEVEAGEQGLAYRRPAPGRRVPAPRAGRREDRPPAATPPRTARRSTPRPARAPTEPPRAPAPPLDEACSSCRSLLDAGRLDEALVEVDGALRRSPLRPELHLMRALVLVEQGRLDAAELACRRSLYLDRNAPFAHFLLAMLRLRRGDRRSAERGLRTTLALGAARPRDEAVPLSAGLTAGGLAAAAQFQLEALGERA